MQGTGLAALGIPRHSHCPLPPPPRATERDKENMQVVDIDQPHLSGGDQYRACDNTSVPQSTVLRYPYVMTPTAFDRKTNGQPLVGVLRTAESGVAEYGRITPRSGNRLKRSLSRHIRRGRRGGPICITPSA